MNGSDPIADMLTRIRNAIRAGHKVVEVPHSRMKEEIARILKREGFIANFDTLGETARKRLRLTLKYAGDGQCAIRGLRRISKPGLRQYAGVDELPQVAGGMGIAILSTSKGILTNREARRQRLGGEVLCYVW